MRIFSPVWLKPRYYSSIELKYHLGCRYFIQPMRQHILKPCNTKSSELNAICTQILPRNNRLCQQVLFSTGPSIQVTCLANDSNESNIGTVSPAACSWPLVNMEDVIIPRRFTSMPQDQARLAQWQSVCLVNRRSQVQTLRWAKLFAVSTKIRTLLSTIIEDEEFSREDCCISTRSLPKKNGAIFYFSSLFSNGRGCWEVEKIKLLLLYVFFHNSGKVQKYCPLQESNLRPSVSLEFLQDRRSNHWAKRACVSQRQSGRPFFHTICILPWFLNNPRGPNRRSQSQNTIMKHWN